MSNSDFSRDEEAYKKLAIKHRHHDEALDKMKFLTLFCSSIDFIVLSGPTGVGKTHLLKRLVLAIWQAFAELVRVEPSCVPVLFTTAVAHGARNFDFKRLYRDGLIGLGDLFVDRRLTHGVQRTGGKVVDSVSTTTSEMRSAIEKEFKERKTRIWIIDEAQHILLGGKSGSVVDQFDVLKSIAQISNIKIVLCGTYQLPDLLRISGQVMRRSSTVQYNRYRNTDKDELLQFASVAKSLMSEVPVDTFPDAAENAEFFHAGSLGCVGVLKDWIARAWGAAHFANRREITLVDFESTKIDDEALELMADEIAWGDAGHGRLEWRLQRTCKADSRSARQKAKKASHPPRPGERNPARDPVGPMKPKPNERAGGTGEDSGD
jgi:Cdc6-like AAA superfamily ATPase